MHLIGNDFSSDYRTPWKNKSRVYLIHINYSPPPIRQINWLKNCVVLQRQIKEYLKQFQMVMWISKLHPGLLYQRVQRILSGECWRWSLKRGLLQPKPLVCKTSLSVVTFLYWNSKWRIFFRAADKLDSSKNKFFKTLEQLPLFYPKF